MHNDQSTDAAAVEAQAGTEAPAPMNAAAAAGPEVQAMAPGTAPLAGCLWTITDAALFLRKSRRWLFLRLRLPDEAQGSIPHVKLGRTPRFIPDDLRLWAGMGFPPVANFKEWRALEEKQRKKAEMYTKKP